jgi:hypothetical protein
MAGDLKPGIDTFEFYPLPRVISKFQYGSRSQTKPNERKKKNNSFVSPTKQKQKQNQRRKKNSANERTQPGFIL